MADSRKYYFMVGILCLIGLMVLAVVFFKERIAFCDTAYQSVFLLTEHKPFMIWMRPGAILPQFIPLAAIAMHAGLKTVMILHSLSFIIFFSLLYILAYRFSERKILFFVIPLYLLLITNEVFYWPQNELQQGMVWLGLYAVFLFEGRWSGMNQWLSLGIHFLFILWIQFFYLLLFFPIAFVIIYYYDSESRLFSRRAVYHIFISVVVFGIRNVVGVFNPYERGKLDVGALIRNNLPHFFHLNSVHMFFQKLPSAYLIYILFLMAALIWLVWQQKYLRAVVVASFSLGYWLLIMISSPNDIRYYTENQLLPLGFLAALPIVVDMIPAIRWRYAPVLFLAAMIVRLGGIYQAHTDYTAHYAVYDPYFDHAKKNKLNGVFVANDLIDQKKAITTWASGYESMLISALVSPDSCRIVQIVDDPNTLSWGLNSDTSAVTIYGIWGQTQLAPYFRLQGGKYEMITKQPSL
jgi:hypothetical protein